jgi:mersacidin/lichenicidin family type 2 lantibiotic
LTLFLFTKVKEIPMSYEKIIRAWKDLDYRLSLSEAERAQLPNHPAGLVELTEKDLEPLLGEGTGATGKLCGAWTINTPTCETCGTQAY